VKTKKLRGTSAVLTLAARYIGAEKRRSLLTLIIQDLNGSITAKGQALTT
jgi:hypothetical protein